MALSASEVDFLGISQQNITTFQLFFFFFFRGLSKERYIPTVETLFNCHLLLMTVPPHPDPGQIFANDTNISPLSSQSLTTPQRL